MYSNTSARINYFFPVSMRAAPSLYEVTGTNYWSIIVDGGQSQSDNIENTIYGTTDYTHVIITDDVSSSGGKVGWIENLNAAARLGFNAEF